MFKWCSFQGFYLWKQKTTLLKFEASFVSTFTQEPKWTAMRHMINVAKHALSSKVFSSLFTQTWKPLLRYFLIFCSIYFIMLKITSLGETQVCKLLTRICNKYYIRILTIVFCPSNDGSRHLAFTMTSALYCSFKVSISPTLKNCTTISTLTWKQNNYLCYFKDKTSKFFLSGYLYWGPPRGRSTCSIVPLK